MTTMQTIQNIRRDMHRRRGVLLLLVLSVLTLFLIMGATLLAVANRARTASRGFETAASNQEGASPIPRAMLDDALFLLIRGSKQAAVQAILTESLLKDMYTTDNNLVPYRVESYDSFDSANTFLTKIADDGTVGRAAFEGTRTKEVDNDGDSVMDGVWLANVLPKITGAGGGQLSFRVSYLVLDLDSRINVNAHGGGGSPVGPASIDGSSLTAFAGNRWTVMQNGGTPAASTMTMNLRQPPVLGQAILGRGSSAYALRLDREAPRPAALTGTVAQNPFTIGELERVLRPFDRDWSALPPRLAAILDDLDNSARRTVTTDSWDVTYRTGAAAPTANTATVPKSNISSIPAGNKQAFATALFDAIAIPPTSPAVVAADPVTAQWVANVAEFWDPASGASALMIGGSPYTGVKPAVLGGAGGDWSAGITNMGDLMGVPKGTQTQVTDILTGNQPGPLESLVAQSPAILEAVGMASQFAATTAQDATREPGRINANTCNANVWDALAGQAGITQPAPPLLNIGDIIRKSAFTPAGVYDIRGLDRGLANRFSSAATVRSNVFAVWITLEVTDGASTAGSPTCHRLFAIVDRSIPVDFVEGENKNVSKTIRLERFLN